MRLLFVGLLALAVTGCISPRRAAERYQPTIDSLRQVVVHQQDSILDLSLSLAGSRGGNEMLLETQSRLQDRLLAQDDTIELLQGTLNSTNDEMRRQLTTLRGTLTDEREVRKNIVNAQTAAVTEYTGGLRQIANLLSDSLETILAADLFEVSEPPGAVVLSVQEEALFRPRSVAYLVKDSENILTLVAAAMQQDPLISLRIVGHTDNQPNPLRNTSNWAYGALRASKLADELATTYYLSPNRLTAASRGEYGPSRSNSTEAGRARNRRLDFVFSSSIDNLLRSLDRAIRPEGE